MHLKNLSAQRNRKNSAQKNFAFFIEIETKLEKNGNQNENYKNKWDQYGRQKIFDRKLFSKTKKFPDWNSISV